MSQVSILDRESKIRTSRRSSRSALGPLGQGDRDFGHFQRFASRRTIYAVSKIRRAVVAGFILACFAGRAQLVHAAKPAAGPKLILPRFAMTEAIKPFVAALRELDSYPETAQNLLPESGVNDHELLPLAYRLVESGDVTVAQIHALAENFKTVHSGRPATMNRKDNSLIISRIVSARKNVSAEIQAVMLDLMLAVGDCRTLPMATLQSIDGELSYGMKIYPRYIDPFALVMAPMVRARLIQYVVSIHGLEIANQLLNLGLPQAPDISEGSKPPYH